MTGVAVCDSACLIALARIRRMDILLDGYDRVYVPETVRRETSRYAIEGLTIRDPASMPDITERIDAGEASVIGLALEIGDAEVVLDDLKARMAATRLGLRVAGTVALVLRAKFEGRIDKIAPVLDSLARDGFRMSDSLRTGALEAANENR